MNKTIPSEQDVDRLLGAFFDREMPNPWPAFAPPVRRTLPSRPEAPPRRRFMTKSHLALAASVALLLACGWLLSGSIEGPKNGRGTINLPAIERGDAQKDKSKPPMPEEPFDWQPDPAPQP